MSNNQNETDGAQAHHPSKTEPHDLESDPHQKRD